MASSETDNALYVTGTGTVTGGVVGGANAIDSSDASTCDMYISSGVGTTLGTERALSKFEIVKSPNGSLFITGLRIHGYNGSTWNTLTLTSVDGDNASLNGDGITIDLTLPSTTETVEVISSNTTVYEAYRAFVFSLSSALSGRLNSFRGYEALGSPDEDCVKGINKLHRGAVQVSDTYDGPVALGVSQNFVRVDGTTSAFTVVLPAVADVVTGKTYIFKKIDATANDVTIDGDGTETIDGATTYVLSGQYDKLVIVSDGTEWLIISE